MIRIPSARVLARVSLAMSVAGARFEISAEIFNALMGKNFPNVISPSNSANVFRITSTQSAARTAQLVFRVTF